MGVLVEGMSCSMEDGEDGGSPPSSDSFVGPGGAGVNLCPSDHGRRGPGLAP